MKASQLVRGYRQIKRVPLPMATAPRLNEGPHPDGEQGSESAPAPIEVGLRPLTPGEEGEIYGRALAYARSEGLEKPAEGDELYEYGKALHRCLLGVVDADSDPKNPEPFFDGGLAQIKGMAELSKDGLLVLAEMHQAFSDEVSGLVAEFSEDDIRATAEELAGPRGGFFWLQWRPGLRVSWTLTTARLLLSLLPDRSSSGSTSETSSTASPRTKPTASAAAAPKSSRAKPPAKARRR